MFLQPKRLKKNRTKKVHKLKLEQQIKKLIKQKNSLKALVHFLTKKELRQQMELRDYAQEAHVFWCEMTYSFRQILIVFTVLWSLDFYSGFVVFREAKKPK